MKRQRVQILMMFKVHMYTFLLVKNLCKIYLDLYLSKKKN